MINIEQLKELRETTGVSVTECKKALEQSGGDFDKAKVILKEWGRELAGKKTSRETHQGIIASYIHPNKKIGVLLELNCETDFVAKSDDFQLLSREICLQGAAMGDSVPILEQPWVKDSSKTVKDLIEQYIAKVGENIVISRFVRYDI